MNLKISNIVIALVFLATSYSSCQEIPGYVTTPEAGAVSVDGAISSNLFVPSPSVIWRVVIFAGQSNQLSAASPSSFPASYNEGFAPTQLYWNNTSMDWEFIGRNNMHNAAVEFARLADSSDVNIRYIHLAQSATGLSLQWNPVTGGTLYNGLVARINNVKASASASNAQIEWVFMDWMQGERDSKDITHANNYESLMNTFINQIRAITSNDMVVTQGKPYSFLPVGSGYLYTSTVRDAKDNIAATDASIFSYDCDGFPQSGDNIHQSMIGQLQRGDFLFNLLNVYLY